MSSSSPTKRATLPMDDASSSDPHARVVDKPIEIGSLIAGKYRVDSLLGEGGMGRVYRAFHVLLERDVALKLLRPEFAASPDARERFLAEARAGNTVRHPHVVDVLDVGVDDGTPFIVQEFLPGESLAKRLELSHRLSIIDAIDVIVPIAAALSHAHKQGILHRDIKPENIFLTEANGGIVPKLVDFGIAQSLREEASDDGVIAGTPAYMAPELVLDSTARDARSDLWSLGVVLYECITGTLPFSAQTPSEVFKAICNESPPPLRSLRPEVPEPIAAIVHRCLARSLSDRMPDAKTLLTSLEQVRADLAGTSSSRVQWQSTIAPGTLRVRPRTKTGTNPVPAELLTIADAVMPAALLPSTAPSTNNNAVVNGVASSEPPGRSLTKRPPSAGPNNVTLAVAVALAMVALVPLLLVQRRRGEVQPDHATTARDRAVPSVGAAPLPANGSLTIAASSAPTPTPVLTTPIAPSDTQGNAAQVASDDRSGPAAALGDRSIERPRRRARVGQRQPDASTRSTTPVTAAPTIQLRDER
jgi:serine/threonine protein kinase